MLVAIIYPELSDLNIAKQYPQLIVHCIMKLLQTPAFLAIDASTDVSNPKLTAGN